MYLEADGGNVLFTMQPWRQFVEIYGETWEFLAALRIAAIQEIGAFLKEHPLYDTSDLQMELLRSLKLRLRETGLTEYPETPEEKLAALEKMNGKTS